MTAWRPQDDDVVRFLQIVTDESRLPAFVHCRRGADRTGMMVAIYRIAVQGWDKEQAIAEMTQGGFRFNSGWQNLVQYVRDLDIDAIRQRAGLAGRQSRPPWPTVRRVGLHDRRDNFLKYPRAGPD